jgi:peptide/nickel transport system permease protein
MRRRRIVFHSCSELASSARTAYAEDGAGGVVAAPLAGADGGSMVIYIARRILYGIPVLVVSSFLIFVFVASATDPLETARTNPRIEQKTIDKVIVENHLNRPVVERYGYWIRDVFTNSFGRTILTQRPILPEIRRVFGHTLQLVIAAEVLALFLAIGIGVFSAVRQYSPFDYMATGMSFLGLAIPVFWLGLILQIIFTNIFVKWNVRIFYTASLSSVDAGSGFHFFLDRLQHLVLPVVTLATVQVAVYSRFMRASMLEVVNADFIRTARAKGLPERVVILRHGVRNALIPLVTLSAITFSGLLGGAVITETIYGLDGMGLFFINSLQNGETYAVMGWLLVVSTLVIVFNLIADIVLGFLDPRIRLD